MNVNLPPVSSPDFNAALGRVLLEIDNRLKQVNGAAWNGPHPVFGGYHLWVTSAGVWRYKSSSPTSEGDGSALGSGGDFVGPASSTDNAIVRFDGTTGKLGQNSGITIADGATGTLSGTNSGDLTLDASVADVLGLTGQSLTADDPAADRLVFWDDSAGKLVYLTVGTGLTIAGTTISNSGSGATGVAINGFRLTLTTATPVTTSDVSTATTIYATPYKGNQIALYDGSSAWEVLSSAEFSLALGTLTSGKNYDVFCYNSAGTPTLEATAWTDDTTRATALVYQDGVLVKSGATTRRYLGTFRTISTTETCDTARQRFLWNYYHRALKKLKVIESTNSWTYSTASFQQANNSAANQVEVVVGVAEDNVRLTSYARATNSTSTVRTTVTGIGVNSTTTSSSDTHFIGQATNTVSTNPLATIEHVALGYTYYAWLERGAGADTQTWYGDAGVTFLQTGMVGTVLC